jgi:RHS repeat-associated protein
MLQIKKSICIPFVFCFVQLLLAQPKNAYMNDVSMPAPNAASLGKFTETPVSYYTGVPNVSVPIYTVQEGPLSLPISFSYHAGGIKLNEPSGWVGTNWALNAGGMISRTVLGIADEGQNGYFNKGNTLVNPDDSTLSYISGIQKDLVYYGSLDAEPDLFSYNFGSYSGKFYFDKDKNPVFVPKTELKIPADGVVVSQLSNGLPIITQLRVLDPNGNIYTFGLISGQEDDGIEYQKQDAAGGIIYPSSWQIKRIETHDKKFSINFFYSKEFYSYWVPGSFTATYLRCSPNNLNFTESCSGNPYGTGTYQCGHIQKFEGRRLAAISTTSETIEFVPETTEREDLDEFGAGAGNNHRRSLKSIKIKKADGTCLKQYNMSYSYMVSPGSTTLSYYKRLFLNSIQGVSCSGTSTTDNPYTFEYYPGTLPNRLSKQIDHWGYFNGASSNEGTQNVPPIPEITINAIAFTPPYATAIRTSNEASMIIGAMKKITYPTKGYTEFTYEANDYTKNKYVYSNNHFFSATNCGVPLPPAQGGTCCNSVVNQVVTGSSGNTTFSFTTAQLTNAKIRIVLTPTSCTSSNVWGGLTAFDPQGVMVGGVGLNYSNWSPPQTSFVQEVALATHFNLQPGVNYTFKISSQDGKAEFSFYFVTQAAIPVQEKVGGLRIKQMLTHDNISVNNDIIKTYSYKKASPADHSSGYLHREPMYYGYAYDFDGLKRAAYVMSNSVVSLGSLDGTHIGYERVVEEYKNGASTNGKTEYVFNVESSFVLPEIVERYPQRQEQIHVRRGQMYKRISYDNTGTTVGDETTTLNIDDYSQGVPNQYIYKVVKIPPCITSVDGGYCWTSYTNRTSVARPKTVTTVQDGITNVVNYEYSTLAVSSLAPKAVEVTRSDNTIVRTEHTYLYDMPVSDVRTEMLKRNMVATPLTTVTKIGGASGIIVSGQQIIYWPFNDNGTFGSSMTNAHPRPWTFRSYEMTWNNGTPTTGSWVTQGTVQSYNAKGLPTSFLTSDWTDPETYTWANNGQILTNTYKAHTTTYEYYPNSRQLKQVTGIDGLKMLYEYDNLMRLSKSSKYAINATTWAVSTDYSYNYADGSTGNNKHNWVNEKTTFASAGSNSSLTTVETKQYMDGLGRSLQTVKKGWAPNATDVVVGAVSYDNQGRVTKEFTPFTGGNNTGNFTTIPTSQKFTAFTYESSPLNRVLTTTPPDWYATTSVYGTNIANEVEFFNGTSGSFYPAGVLVKNTTVVPKTASTGVAKVTFTDKSGRLILTRIQAVTSLSPLQFSSTDKADTYQFYDDKNRIVKILPPDAANTTADLHKRFEYTYDARDLVLTKKVPDQNHPVKFVYNAREQMVFSQDPNMSQTSGGRWLMYSYDDYGRPVKSGFATYTGTSPNAASPGTYSEVHSETTYGTTGIEIGKIKQVKTYIPGTSTPITRDMTYDAVTGQTLTNNGNNHLTNGTGSDNFTYTYDYAGNVLTEVRTHKTSATATALTLTTRKTYDHAGRNVALFHRINTNTERQLASYAYDFRDRLIDKSLGQHTGMVSGVPTSGFLQSIDYAYNELNWLTGINSSTVFTVSEKAIANCALVVGPLGATFAANPDPNDLFKMTLNYDAPQTFTGQPAAPVGQRNGNISQLIWQVRGRERQAYNVTYDFLDRMLDATYLDINSSGTANTTNRYRELATYADKRGNFNTLTRNGMFKATAAATCWTPGTIDNLTYTYVSGTNRLQKIADAAGTANSLQRNAGFNPGLATSTATYSYDVNGNMTNDPYKAMAISYNHLNLPTVFNFGAGKTIDVLYDFSGLKLRKTVKSNATTVVYTQDYAGGLEYRTTGNTGTLTLEAIYHNEGRITPNGSAFRYEYNIKDHLGNTRLSFADINNDGKIDVTGDAATTEILNENHYYPFGMNMGFDWLNNTALSPDNRYQYNGKEMNDDFGLNWNDYGFRWYDASVGRWASADPISLYTPNYSPYHYSFNNPVRFIDHLGLTPTYDWAAHYKGDKGVYRDFDGTQVSWGGVAANLTADLPKAFYTIVGNSIDSKKMKKIAEGAASIFAKNGFKGLSITEVSVDEASKHTTTYEYQMFLAIIDHPSHTGSGNSARMPNGRIGVFKSKYDSSTDKNRGTAWSSYINLDDTLISDHKNPDYATSYIMAHEYLHQFLAIASYHKENNPHKFGHEDTAPPNLNKDGRYITIPTGPSKELQPAETILDHQKSYLNNWLQEN